MASRATLKAKVDLDSSKFDAKLTKTKQKVDVFKRSLSGVAGSIGMAFGVGAIVSSTNKLIEFASEIQHTSDNLRVSTDVLQGLNSMALRYGLTVDMVGRSLTRVILAQAKADSDPLIAKSLKALNIEAKEFEKLDTGRAVEELGVAFNKLGRSKEALTALTDILGKNLGPKATAFLGDLGVKGLDNVVAKSKKAGTTIEKELIAKLELLGTKNDVIVLKMQVGWAKFLSVIGDTASVLGGMAGNLEGAIFGGRSWKERLNFFETQKRWAKWLVGGGINETIQAGADEIATPLEEPEIKTGLVEAKTAHYERKKYTDEEKAERKAKRKDIEEMFEAEITMLNEKAQKEKELAEEKERKEKELIELKKIQLQNAVKEAEILSGATISLQAPQAAHELQRIGGFIGGTSDPMQRKIERQIAIQKSMDSHLADIARKVDGRYGP